MEEKNELQQTPSHHTTDSIQPCSGLFPPTPKTNPTTVIIPVHSNRLKTKRQAKADKIKEKTGMLPSQSKSKDDSEQSAATLESSHLNNKDEDKPQTEPNAGLLSRLINNPPYLKVLH